MEKFTCETSRFLLPAFRRPGYREVMDTRIDNLSADQVFRRWTQEQGQYYHLINTALLNDDLDVLKKNIQFINSLRHAIRTNHKQEAMKVYRGLCITDDDAKKEYRTGLQFLWPTFTCTSRNRRIAEGFGNYLFEIDVSTNDMSYRADIAHYSEYPEEEEILFYPYTGFVVTEVIPDAKVIKLKSVDTIAVEKNSEKQVPDKVTIFDKSRNTCVYLSKTSTDTLWSYGDKPDEKYLIAANRNGYWDAPYRYHHKNGYFIDKGDGNWEEYHHDRHFANFVRIN